MRCGARFVGAHPHARDKRDRWLPSPAMSRCLRSLVGAGGRVVEWVKASRGASMPPAHAHMPSKLAHRRQLHVARSACHAQENHKPHPLTLLTKGVPAGKRDRQTLGHAVCSLPRAPATADPQAPPITTSPSPQPLELASMAPQRRAATAGRRSRCRCCCTCFALLACCCKFWQQGR
jgi:hypothetical protein